jgi:Co/Zn/Cd efflux system component
MSASCGHHGHHHDHSPGSATGDAAYRRVLWIALAINAAMFAVEIGVGVGGGSKALLADAIDFLGDAANYALSLFVLGMALVWRARAALLKGAAMIAFGLAITGATIAGAVAGTLPHAASMGAVGVAALAANVLVAVLLFRHRAGDSNRRAVWLCTRNDAIGNVAVMLAAAGVFASGTPWPDLAVAAIMAGLAIVSGTRIVRQAAHEIAHARAPAVAARPTL